MCREISEELSISISDERRYLENEYEFSKNLIRLMCYTCKYHTGKIVLEDHDEYKWVEIIDLLNYDFLNSDIEIIENLIFDFKEG